MFSRPLAALGLLAALATAPAQATVLIPEMNSSGTGGDFFKLWNSGGLAKHVIGEAQQLVEDHLQEIIDAWNKHFPG